MKFTEIFKGLRQGRAPFVAMLFTAALLAVTLMIILPPNLHYLIIGIEIPVLAIVMRQMINK
ncbi:hypothetical protein ACH5AL_24470 [Actinacidiphila glaucinigra]|uniref:hypothetical protein n=1 Tax=Actinacidiphila glaucinigra TaxID=235986 RepID=UPI00378F9320